MNPVTYKSLFHTCTLKPFGFFYILFPDTLAWDKVGNCINQIMINSYWKTFCKISKQIHMNVGPVVILKGNATTAALFSLKAGLNCLVGKNNANLVKICAAKIFTDTEERLWFYSCSI